MEYAKVKGLNREVSRADCSHQWVDVGCKHNESYGEIARESVTDPVGPEFMAPPARSLELRASA